MLGLCTVRDAVRHRNMYNLAAAQRALRIISGLRFNTNNHAARHERTRCNRATGQQPVADRHEKVIQLPPLPQSVPWLRCPLPGYHVAVIVRRYDGQAPFACQAICNDFAILQFPIIQYHLGAVGAGCRQFHRRRVAGQHDHHFDPSLCATSAILAHGCRMKMPPRRRPAGRG